MYDFDVRQAAKFFDEQYFRSLTPTLPEYLATHPEYHNSAFDYFCNRGHELGISPNIYFSPSYYLQERPDVAKAIKEGHSFTSAFHHFMMCGHKETTIPTIHFNQPHYLERNPDVKAAIDKGDLGSGIEHFMRWGANEYGRMPSKILISCENRKFKVEDTSDFEVPKAIKGLMDDYLLPVLQEVADSKNMPKTKVLASLDFGLAFMHKFAEVIKQGGTISEAAIHAISEIVVDSLIVSMYGGASMHIAKGFGVTFPPHLKALGFLGGAAMWVVADKIDPTKQVIDDMKHNLELFIRTNQVVMKDWAQMNHGSTENTNLKDVDIIQKEVDHKYKPVNDYIAKYHPDAARNDDVMATIQAVNSGSITNTIAYNKIDTIMTQASHMQSAHDQTHGAIQDWSCSWANKPPCINITPLSMMDNYNWDH